MTLIERCEAAQGGDRKLDAAVYRFFAIDRQDKHWFTFAEGEYYSDDTVPAITSSIDAALALVERKKLDKREALRFAIDRGSDRLALSICIYVLESNNG